MRIILSWVFALFTLVFLVSCGAWLGNPKDFSDNDEKKSKAEPEPSLQLYASISQATSDPVVVKSRDGQSETSLQIESITLGWHSLTLSDGGTKLALFPKESIKFSDNTSVKLLEDTRTLAALGSVEITWDDAVGLHIQGRYQNKHFVLTLQPPTILLESQKSISVDRTLPLVFGFELTQWFDFSGQQTDLQALDGQSLDLDQNTSTQAVLLRTQIQQNMMDSLGFGFDQDGDRRLKEAENLRSAPASDVPTTPDTESPAAESAPESEGQPPAPEPEEEDDSEDDS